MQTNHPIENLRNPSRAYPKGMFTRERGAPDEGHQGPGHLGCEGGYVTCHPGIIIGIRGGSDAAHPRSLTSTTQCLSNGSIRKCGKA